MDNYHAELINESNRKLITALGMHWENEANKQKGQAPTYTDGHFFDLANGNYF